MFPYFLFIANIMEYAVPLCMSYTVSYKKYTVSFKFLLEIQGKSHSVIDACMLLVCRTAYIKI